MPERLKAVRCLGILGALVLAGCTGAATGSFEPSSVASRATSAMRGWLYEDGVLYHRPHYAASSTFYSAVPAYWHVPYLGGAVIITPKFYFVFWGYKKYGDPHKVEPLLLTYTKNMGGSAHNNIETQYYEEMSSKKTYITNSANQFGGTWDDASAVPKAPTDAQVAAEALKAAKHFRYDPNGVYLVATPHNHSEVGFPTNWCAYHSVASVKKQEVPYIYLPYVPDGGAGCGADAVKPPPDESGPDEGVTIMAGHEFGEAITDPTPSTAWDGPQGEIADQCQWHNLANEPFGSKSYTMQPMASNADNACVQSYSGSDQTRTEQDAGQALLYLSDVKANDVEVFSYPQGRHIGTLTNFGAPRAECADSAGNVWIADAQAFEILEYPHGATKPIHALSTPGAPRGCSVDSKRRNVAVTLKGYGIGLAIYHQRSGGQWLDPRTYPAPFAVAFCGYDSAGNLFLDGTAKDGTFRLGELPRGGAGVEAVAVDTSIAAPGQVQWDGKYVAVGDSGVSPSVVYQLSISGSSATMVGSTALGGTKSVRQFWIEGSHVVGPDYDAPVGIWDYPSGGSPIKEISAVRGYGAAISVASDVERK